DDAGRLWASELVGPPGFAHVFDETTIAVDARGAPGDPLGAVLARPAKVGMIALEPPRRRRMRVNGRATPSPTGLRIAPDQVYSNCTKYISRREIEVYRLDVEPTMAHRATELDIRMQKMIGAADTFFVATADDAGNADASHRGGNPGFLRVLSPTQLRWPDYRGNSMFMTLGNIAV